MLVEQDGPRPAGADCRVRRELLEVECSEDSEVVIAHEGDRGALPNERDDLVRPRSVPDEVAEAPQGVRGVGVDRLEDGLERV